MNAVVSSKSFRHRVDKDGINEAIGPPPPKGIIGTRMVDFGMTFVIPFDR